MGQLTRFSVLKNRQGLLLGKDNDHIFEEGQVYEVHKIAGEIILKKIGGYSLAEDAKDGDYPTSHSTNQAIIYSGKHLITKKELKNIKQPNTPEQKFENFKESLNFKILPKDIIESLKKIKEKWEDNRT